MRVEVIPCSRPSSASLPHIIIHYGRSSSKVGAIHRPSEISKGGECCKINSECYLGGEHHVLPQRLRTDTDSQPGIYVFGELLDQPSIQDVSYRGRLITDDSSQTHHMLIISLYCNYSPLVLWRITMVSNPLPRVFHADNLASSDSVPTLNDTQLLKLKHLTLVSLALRNRVCHASCF